MYRCAICSNRLTKNTTDKYTGHATFASLVLRHPIDAHTICLHGNTYTSVRKRDHATGYFHPTRYNRDKDEIKSKNEYNNKDKHKETIEHKDREKDNDADKDREKDTYKDKEAQASR